MKTAKDDGGAPTNSPLLTIEDAAEYLRVHPSTVYRMARRRDIPAVKVGKHWRVDWRALQRWLETMMQVPAVDHVNGDSSRDQGERSRMESGAKR